VIKAWSWEILSLVLAWGILAAVIAILVHFNKQPIPQWPVSINLNTVVALLSTVFRAATLVAVAQVLGQLRWMWFRNPRPLLDLHRIDSASRSSLGALLLLLRAPSNALILLGTVITTISLAIGPFMQQSIKTYACEQQIPGTNASIPTANYATGEFARTAAAILDPNFSIKGIMINGLKTPGSNNSVVPVSCPTGNCTFQAYAGITHSSIGLCSSCLDTTSGVSKPKNSKLWVGNITLPNGLWIATSNEQSSLSVGGYPEDFAWASSSFTPSFATAASQAILNVSVLTFTTASCSDSPLFSACADSFTNNVPGFERSRMRPLAVSCAIYPCLKNYHASVTNGQLDETLVSTTLASLTDSGSTSNNPIKNLTAIKEPCVLDGQAYDSGNFSLVGKSHRFEAVAINGTNVTVPFDCLYKLHGLYARSLTYFMRETVFIGKCGGTTTAPDFLHCYSAFWLDPFWAGGSANSSSVSSIMDNFATLVTNNMRETGTSLYSYSNGTEMRSNVLGAVNSVTVCTQFDWKWLILPAALLLLSTLLLLFMIVANYRGGDQPVWKASSLPLVFYGGLSGSVSGTETQDMDQLEELATRTYARFHTGDVVGFERVTSAVEQNDEQYEVDSLMTRE